MLSVGFDIVAQSVEFWARSRRGGAISVVDRPGLVVSFLVGMVADIAPYEPEDAPAAKEVKSEVIKFPEILSGSSSFRI